MTVTSSTLVAPSPSSATARASSTQTSVNAAVSAAKSGCVSASIRGLCARPLASANTASLVLVSPSIVRLPKLSGIAARSALPSTVSSIAASVVTNASTVASSGATMPEPLANAATRTSTPPSDSVRDASFTCVSVVKIASAASSIASLFAATSAGAAATSLCTGKRTPMTPVDAASTAPSGTPSCAATAAHTARASATPSGPVSAFAFPLLMTIARTSRAGRRAAASRTGAAREAFCVKHPAAAHGASLATRARSLRAALMPACTPAYEKPRGIRMSAAALFPGGPADASAMRDA